MEALLASVTVPTWAIVVGTIALIILLMLWLRPRPEGADPFTSFTHFALLLVIGALGFFGLKHLEDEARNSERNATALRASALFAQTSQNGIASCIDGSKNRSLHEACEKILFSEPQRTTAALALTRQRLGFISEIIAYPATRDLPMRDQIESLRTVVEEDPFGFVAQTMAENDGCIPEYCPPLNLLRDPSHVAENLKEKKFEVLLAKHLAGTADASRTDDGRSTSNELSGSINLVIPTVDHSLIQNLRSQPPASEGPSKETTVTPALGTPKSKQKNANASGTSAPPTPNSATPQSAPTPPPPPSRVPANSSQILR